LETRTGRRHQLWKLLRLGSWADWEGEPGSFWGLWSPA